MGGGGEGHGSDKVSKVCWRGTYCACGQGDVGDPKPELGPQYWNQTVAPRGKPSSLCSVPPEHARVSWLRLVVAVSEGGTSLTSHEPNDSPPQFEV